jgi:secondary thiamine-phosphate synthase enzyme
MQIATTGKRQVVDVTDSITNEIQGSGVVTVFVQHSTAAMTVMDLDPGTDKDLLDFLDSLVPDRQWRHPHDPSHAPDHLLASLVGPSVTIPFQDGKLLLGSWQRVVLIEFDGPRSRTISVTTS